jgi:hypothetical protein
VRTTAFGARAWIGAAIGLLVFGVTSVRAEVACPNQLSVQQRADPPSGWSVTYQEIAPRLSAVSIFDGPPSNRVSLKVDKRRQTGRELTLAWKLHDSPRSYYLQCGYERTTAQISLPLPPGVRECEVVMDRTASYPGGGLAVKRMVCR